jgi:hypothetical protein
VFSFGIGSSVNRHLMEGLARAGMGEPFIITKPAEAAEQAARFRKMIDSPVLTNVKAARLEGWTCTTWNPATARPAGPAPGHRVWQMAW